ncbi:MAG: shikimate kinase [Micrococcales bacterium]|nr:MAG: shikimate kinase [Micrococcales bacterium]PIE26757.1 MAG: shikimate kinase [Micrococcales bacterium]
MSRPLAGAGASGRTGPRSIVLIGPMGCGKTTVAGILGRLTGLPVIDTDEVVQRRTGRTIGDIFIDDGEPAFRAMEREAVAEALSGPAAVVALGGGAVLADATRTQLEQLRAGGGQVVFLDVDAKAASSRVGLGAGRPLLLGNPRATWLKLLEERRPLYERLAGVHQPTTDLTPDQVAERILHRGPSRLDPHRSGQEDS